MNQLITHFFRLVRAGSGGRLARPGQARPGQARPGKTRPGQARPGQARPGQTRPGQATPLTGRGNSVQGPHYKRGHLLLRCTDAHLQPGINSTQTIAKIQPCLHLKYSSFLCLNNFQIRATDIKIMLLPLSSKPSLPLAIPAYIILCCTARARQTWSRSRLRRDSRLTIDISNWDGTNSMQANILTALIILPPSYSAVELRTAAISEDLLAIGSLCNSLISLS